MIRNHFRNIFVLHRVLSRNAVGRLQQAHTVAFLSHEYLL